MGILETAKQNGTTPSTTGPCMHSTVAAETRREAIHSVLAVPSAAPGGCRRACLLATPHMWLLATPHVYLLATLHMWLLATPHVCPFAPQHVVTTTTTTTMLPSQSGAEGGVITR